MSTIRLPWPPAGLSGHAKGHWRTRATLTQRHRHWASLATRDARARAPEAAGDIHLRVTFIPPDRRSDRANFPVRCKAYFDGIADGLGVNDRRFVPHFVFAEPEKPGRVEVVVLDGFPVREV